MCARIQRLDKQVKAGLVGSRFCLPTRRDSDFSPAAAFVFSAREKRDISKKKKWDELRLRDAGVSIRRELNVASVPCNAPALFFSSQVSSSRALSHKRTQKIDTSSFDMAALSQTAFKIAEKLIILLAVFLYKQARGLAKMFWGVISMLL